MIMNIMTAMPTSIWFEHREEGEEEEEYKVWPAVMLASI